MKNLLTLAVTLAFLAPLGSLRAQPRPTEPPQPKKVDDKRDKTLLKKIDDKKDTTRPMRVDDRDPKKVDDRKGPSDRKETARPSLTKVGDATMEVLDVTFEVAFADRESVVRDPAKFLKMFLESHGQKVNNIALSTKFLQGMSNAIKNGPMDAPVWVSGKIHHVSSGKSKSSQFALDAKAATQSKQTTGIKKVDDVTIEFFEATFELSDADRETILKDPAKFQRKFLESQGQKVNGVFVSTSFVKEMSIIIGNTGKDRRPYVRLGYWHCNWIGPQFSWWFSTNVGPK